MPIFQAGRAAAIWLVYVGSHPIAVGLQPILQAGGVLWDIWRGDRVTRRKRKKRKSLEKARNRTAQAQHTVQVVAQHIQTLEDIGVTHTAQSLSDMDLELSRLLPGGRFV